MGNAKPSSVAARGALATPAPSLIDRQLDIETPEHVSIGYALAGPGSRFAAFLIDGLLLMLGLLALFIGALGLLLAGMSTRTLLVVLAIVLLGAFVLAWGYFIYFEGFRDGQTPGKRRLGLRVIEEGGHPLTLRGAVVRNLLRIIDIQPFPSWIVGGGMIVLHPRAQRIGDIAAGTIVVRERRVAALPEETEGSGPPRYSERAYEVLREYALRRDALERAVRDRVALKLAPHYVAAGARQPLTANACDALLQRAYAEESGRRVAAGVRGGSGSPAAALLLRRQKRCWAEYGVLLGRARERGLAALPEADVSRFAALYREVAADLARARTYGASPELLYSLERSVGGGHNLLYTRTARGVRKLRQWLTAGFPALVRRRATVLMIASALLFGPALVSFGAIVAEPERARVLLPAEMIARAEAGASRQEAGRGYAEVPELLMPAFSSSLIANNVQVGFMAFAGGVLAGVGTVFVLLINGIMLGSVAGLFHVERLDGYLWSFVLPHGVLEMSAICIAGAAGLWLGSGLVVPGRRSRRAALVARGREAVSLLGGTVVLLVIAGVIEGFISPSPVFARELKMLLGVLTGVLLASYLILAGKD